MTNPRIGTLRQAVGGPIYHIPFWEDALEWRWRHSEIRRFYSLVAEGRSGPEIAKALGRRLIEVQILALELYSKGLDTYEDYRRVLREEEAS